MKFPRNKKENYTCLPGIIRTDPTDPAPSVQSRILNWFIFLSAGNVGLKNSVPWKLFKPWMMLEFVPAAAATIRLICAKKCSHKGCPLNRFACKHNNEDPTVSIFKVGSDRSIPMVENIILGHLSLGIQYDTGCQLSLISRCTSRATLLESEC